MKPQNKTIRPRVVTAQEAASDPSKPEQSYLEKVTRYIPGEVVAAYLFISGLLSGAQNVPEPMIQYIVFAAFLVVTPLWTYAATRVPDKAVPWYQIIASIFGFASWVFALGGPFAHEGWYQPVYGSVLIVFVTLVMPLAERLFVPSSQSARPASGALAS